MFSKNETILLRRACDCLRERLERSARKTDHDEIYALMRKDIFALEEILTKLEVV